MCKRILLLGGPDKVGKTTFADYLSWAGWLKLSFATPVKELLGPDASREELAQAYSWLIENMWGGLYEYWRHRLQEKENKFVVFDDFRRYEDYVLTLGMTSGRPRYMGVLTMNVKPPKEPSPISGLDYWQNKEDLLNRCVTYMEGGGKNHLELQALVMGWLGGTL